MSRGTGGKYQQALEEGTQDSDGEAGAGAVTSSKMFVLDAENETEGQPLTVADCPECGHTEAFFKEMQTRSADEPATVFYMCASKTCAHRWKEG